MASNDLGEKTELPSARRRQEVRRSGQVARSVDLNSAMQLLVVTILLSVLGLSLVQSAGNLLTTFLSRPVVQTLDVKSTTALFEAVGSWSVEAVLPWLLVLIGAALLVNLGQVGFLVAPETIQPKLSRLNPIQGLKRIFSLVATVRLGLTLGKLIAVAVTVAIFLQYRLPQLSQLNQVEPAAVLTVVISSVCELGFAISIVLIVLARLDLGFQKWKFTQDLKMTKQEVREELKQMEGDETIRQRRRAAHRQLAQASESQTGYGTDVVIVELERVGSASD